MSARHKALEKLKPCEECGGTGWTVQGWTDKNGFSEDQYGPCAVCVSQRGAQG